MLREEYRNSKGLSAKKPKSVVPVGSSEQVDASIMGRA